jgi:hypothetical protein
MNPAMIGVGARRTVGVAVGVAGLEDIRGEGIVIRHHRMLPRVIVCPGDGLAGINGYRRWIEGEVLNRHLAVTR